MSAKLTCPGCSAHTSAVYRAWCDGGGCPYGCGNPLDDPATNAAGCDQ